MAASIAMSSLATTMVDVDINLLRKDPILAAREDASLDATAPSSSCDFSHSTPESCSDGDSVEGSLGPTISPSNPLEDKEQSRRVSFSNVVVRGKHKEELRRYQPKEDLVAHQVPMSCYRIPSLLG